MTSEGQSAGATPQTSLFRPFDLLPMLAVGTMLTGYVMYTGAQPHTLQMTWGKTILMPLGNFLLFSYLLLSKVVPMLRAHLLQRRASILEAVQSFDQQSGNIADRFKEIKDKLEQVETETAQIIIHAEQQAEQEKEQAMALAQEQAARIRKSAHDLTQYERHRILQRLRRRLIDRAFARAEELLNESINDEDQLRLQADYLKLVEKIS